MALSRRRGRTRLTLLFLVLTSITVITLDFRGDGSEVFTSIREVASDALAPVRNAAGGALEPVGNAFSGITGYGALEDENAALRARLAELEGDSAGDTSAATDRRELLDLLSLDFVGNIPTVAARVVSAPVSNFEQTIELDRGRSDGVDVNMPVVTGAGLVGRVVQASGSRSVVRLITDPSSAVGVRLIASGEVGIAAGEGAGRALSVGFIDDQTDIGFRELVVTSGLEGGSDIFPADIPVGRVIRNEVGPGDLERNILIDPSATFDEVRFVKVIQYEALGAG